jgi:hypothetical protein
MKIKVIVLAFIVALASWAQTTTPTAPNSAPDAKAACACCDKTTGAADSCPCCQKMKDGKAGSCCAGMKKGACCQHKNADGKMACCNGAACDRTSKNAKAGGCCGKQCPMAAKGHTGCCANCKGGTTEGK